MDFALVQPREVMTADTYSAPFFPTAAKLRVVADVFTPTAGGTPSVPFADFRLRLQMWDEGSQVFVTLWDEPSTDYASRAYHFTPQLQAFYVGEDVNVFVAPQMRVGVVDLAGPVTVALGVFGATSRRLEF